MSRGHEPSDDVVLRDQDDRNLIVEATDRNVVVLAGAGAGKTHALVERIVAAVRNGVVRVDEMAAITFTRKAAGEMRGRVFLRLREEAARSQGDQADRIGRALEQIDQAFIGTIHAFCGRMLRERPLDAGLPPDFTEVEPREEARLRREAWDRFVQERFAADDDRIYALEEHGVTPEDLFPFFRCRCDYADLPLKDTATPRPDLGPATEAVKRFVQEIGGHIPARPEKRDGVMDAIRRARHFLENHGLESPHDEASLLALFDGNLRVTLKHWDDRDFARELRDERLPRLQGEVVEPALRAWKESAYRLIAEFVDAALDAYEAVRRAKAVVTFQDLLLRSALILREGPDVRAYFQRRYRSILVDEFQDTDPIQAEILLYLTGTDLHERDWRRLAPRPGSLFLVGDEKQSIYRFRRADVETFRDVRRCMEATGGLTAHLNTSFRARASLCRWINGAFPSLFDERSGLKTYQAEFSPLFEFRPPGIDPHGVRKITISKVARNARRAVVQADAARIADFIAAAVGGATPLNHDDEESLLAARASPGDFMILTRTSTQLSVYAHALESRDVPFDVAGGGRLGDSAELRALTSVLEAVLLPDDPLPLLAYLRGPLVGLADDELYAFRSSGGEFDFREAVPGGLEEALSRRVRSAWDFLHRAERYLTTSSPAVAVERILDEIGLTAFAAVHPDGRSSTRAGSLLRVMALVRRHAADGRPWGEIVEDLRALIDDSGYDLEEMTVEAGRDDVVRLMNLHQAKGLQANVVFLADPCDTTADRWTPDMHVSRSAERVYLSMIVKKPKGDFGSVEVARPAGWSDDLAEELRFESAEEMRLLYVAATRARNLLVVSRYEGNTSIGPWHRLNPFLEAVPELPVVPRPASSPYRNEDFDWVAMRDDIAAARARLSEPSYRVRTVTGGRTDAELDYGTREGRGREYGIVIHQLFEDAMLRRLPHDESEYVRRLVREAGLDAGLAGDADAALERLRSSALWEEVRRADQVFTEVPLGRYEHVPGGPGVVRGVIDLAYRLHGSWRLVDFKTDAATTAEEIADLQRKYEPQLREYAVCWEAIAGEPPSSAELWFVHAPEPG